MGILSNTAKLAMAGSLALYQMVAVSAAPLSPEEARFFQTPAYLSFANMVKRYQWKDSVFRLGLGGSEVELIRLRYDIMNHDGRPDGFGLEDLGQVGCLPGQEGNGLPGHSGLTLCHAVGRHEDGEDALPEPEAPKV